MEEVNEVVFLLPTEDSSAQDIQSGIQTFMSTRAGENKYEETSDSSISAMGHITVYCNRQPHSSSGRDMALLTKVEGGYTLLDGRGTVVVTAQELNYGCSDLLVVQSLTQRPTTI